MTEQELNYFQAEMDRAAGILYDRQFQKSPEPVPYEELFRLYRAATALIGYYKWAALPAEERGASF